MTHKATSREDQGTRERVAAALIGAFFVGIALAILASFVHELSVGPVLAAVVIGGLGIEALISAVRKRRCLLSRIGPLP
jgi:small basic protein